MPKGKARVTSAQSNILCTFFEENAEVIRGYRKLSKCREAVQIKWKKISPQLNSVGPSRDHKAWAKYLCDLKAKLKRKRIKWRQNSNGTGPIICNADDFSEIELRMLQVLRKELPNSQDTQDINTPENEMEENSLNVDNDFINNFTFQDTKNEMKQTNTSSFIELQLNDTPPPEPYAHPMFCPQNEHNDEFDTFGRNIAQQLRTLPLAIALETQEILFSVVRNQRLKIIKKHSNDSIDPLDK